MDPVILIKASYRQESRRLHPRRGRILSSAWHTILLW
jgi:hypothetical protein